MPDNLYHHANQSNFPSDWADLRKDLAAMPAEELAEEMEHIWASMTEETYDDAVICAYLDELDRKAPMPEMPDVEEAYANFQQLFRDPPQKNKRNIGSNPPKRIFKFRRLLHTALVAVISVLCILGCMITAQAFGIDVLGAMAHWTEEVFSFGVIHVGSIEDSLSADATCEPSQEGQSTILPEELEYTSLQEALEALDITEIVIPAHFPEGYDICDISVMNNDNADVFTLCANYEGSDGSILSIVIARYSNEPTVQVQKTDSPVDTIVICGVTYYLIENNRNYTMAWFTEHYECYISGSDQKILREIANSMYE